MNPPHAEPARRHVLLALLLAVVPMLETAWGGAPAAELVCAPSSRGCITTWLVAGPIRFLRPEQFDTDFLKAGGGEAAVRPREGDMADPVNGLPWQARVFPQNVLNLREKCLPIGESAFYFSAVLIPRRDVDATLLLTHSGWARVWLDGKPVLKSDYDPYSMGYRTAAQPVSLRKGRRVHCLVKIGSRSRSLQLICALRSGRVALGSDDLAVALPVGQGGAPAVAAHVFSSLSLVLGPERFATPGRTSLVLLAVQGGYPECGGKVAAEVTVKNAKGLVAETLKSEPSTIAALAKVPAQLRWAVAKQGATASYELLARVSYDGKEIGALSHTVYAPSEILQWTRDIVARLKKLQADKKPSRDTVAHVLLKVEKARLLGRGATAQSFAADEVHRELKVADQWLARIAAGKPVPPPVEPGVHEHAYSAEQDDSVQPYYLHIPRSYTGNKPVPAIVYLHGYSPDLDKANWHMPSPALTDLADARGYVIIVPYARSNTDFQAIGETDVLHVLGLARRRVKIDPDRTFLVGYSMGGMGAYTIAAHHPHLWAGVVALCARADYFYWKGLDAEKVEPFKRHVLDMEFGWPLAQNFLHVPVFAFQGTNDMLIKPEQAPRFVDRLLRLGCTAQLRRLEGQSHWIADEVFSSPDAFDWMDRLRRAEAPRTIRYTTYSLRYHRAYWLTIDAVANQGRPASVDLTLDPHAKSLTLVTRNVSVLTLRPPTSLLPGRPPLKATVNGKSDQFKPTANGAYVIALKPVPRGPFRKLPGLCGPVKDAFNRRFLLVYGTAGDKETTQANRRAAARLLRDWERFAQGSPRPMADTAVTAAEMARSNLVLFGTPKSNAVLARIAAKLPIRFTPAGYQVGQHTYKANDTTGLLFIHPNPLAPRRYVVVCSGAHYGERLGVNHKYDLLPDFIVYSTEADYDDSNATYCAGFFDNTWKLSDTLTWHSDGLPKPRPRAAETRPEAPPASPKAPAAP